MTIVFSNSGADDTSRRELIFGGGVFVYAATPASRALIDFAQELIAEAFGARDPRTAHQELGVEELAQVLVGLKPKFINHPTCKKLLPALVEEYGGDLDRTFFDVPRLRTSAPAGHLTSGISYSYHAHRDCWYAAPFSQVNWWIPIFQVTPDNVMAFHPRYFDRPVPNGSVRYDYERWVRDDRANAAQHVHSDTREQPKPEGELDLEPTITVVPEPGGVIMFSGAHLHSSVPNTSGLIRFSIDFRTVHLDDVAAHRGAPNVDAQCSGTTLRDFYRCSDLERFPEALAAEYDTRATVTVAS